MIGGLAACGGSNNTPTAPTATVTPLPTNAPTATKTATTQPPLASLTVSPLMLRPAFSPSIYDYAVALQHRDEHPDARHDGGCRGRGLAERPRHHRVGAIRLGARVAHGGSGRGGAGPGRHRLHSGVLDPLPAPTTFRSWPRPRHPAVGSPTPGWYLIGNVFIAARIRELCHDRRRERNSDLVSPYDVLRQIPPSSSHCPTRRWGYTSPTLPIGTLYHLNTWTTQAISTVGIPMDNHELLLLPNGDFMLMSYPPLTGVDLTGLETYGANSTILDCAVQEVDPQGNLVWDWRASNHIDPVKESVVPAGAGTDASPADVYHCNSST